MAEQQIRYKIDPKQMMGIGGYLSILAAGVIVIILAFKFFKGAPVPPLNPDENVFA
jgi:hypothetical protein